MAEKKLLDIIDDTHHLADQQAEDSFMYGVRYGVLFMAEAFGGSGMGDDCP